MVDKLPNANLALDCDWCHQFYQLCQIYFQLAISIQMIKLVIIRLCDIYIDETFDWKCLNVLESPWNICNIFFCIKGHIVRWAHL